MILTDAKGRPIPKPEREDFSAGLPGDLAFLDARHAWRDEVALVANGAFDDAFRAALRRTA
jgi:hypothetical protein